MNRSFLSISQGLRAHYAMAASMTVTTALLPPNRVCAARSVQVARMSSSVLTSVARNSIHSFGAYYSTQADQKASSTDGARVILPGSTAVSADPLGGSSPTYIYSPKALPPRQDPLLHFFVNLLMRDGKKASAERYIADMLAEMAKLTNADPLPLVYEAVELAKPLLRMQSRKQGGKSLQVPIPLNSRQSTRRALKWIIQASDRRSDRSISRRLAVEVLAILEGNSSVLSRRDEQHKIGTNNRANASVRI